MFEMAEQLFFEIELELRLIELEFVSTCFLFKPESLFTLVFLICYTELATLSLDLL